MKKKIKMKTDVLRHDWFTGAICSERMTPNDYPDNFTDKWALVALHTVRTHGRRFLDPGDDTDDVRWGYPV